MLKAALCVLFVHKTCRSARQLVFCILSMSKVTSCVCLCVRPAEAPGRLSFVSLLKFIDGKALRKKINLLPPSQEESHVFK